MNTLFPIEPLLPPGFIYQPDFISREEETELVNHISRIKLHTFQFQGYEAKRRVASFGYDWSFEKRSLSRGKEIPTVFDPLITKVADHISIHKEEIAEFLITEYPPGSVINWHRDAPPFDLIAGISLLADCTFRLRPFEKSKQGRGSIVSFQARRRSIYVMKDASRTDWQHSITPVKELRYSVTLRTLKQGNSH